MKTFTDALSLVQSTKKERLEISWDGYPFNSQENVWEIHRHRNLNLGLVFRYLDVSLHDAYRAVMRDAALNLAAETCMRLNQRFSSFLRTENTRLITITSLLNARTMKKDFLLRNVRALLQRWHKLKYPGVSDEVIDLLSSWKLRKREVGAAVKSLDANKGPLDDQELQRFNEGVAQAFELGHITLSDLAFAHLLSHTGRRPEQLLQLLTGHLITNEQTKGNARYLVKIPRLKQRGTPATERETKNFAVTETLFRILEAQKASVIDRFTCQFGDIPDSVIVELPLFPNWKYVNKVQNIRTLKDYLNNDILHEKGADLHSKLQRIIRESKIVSIRAGELLKGNPQRFRYTIGSRAAREGFGAAIIAELLDHRNTSSARIYVRDHPNFRQHIDAAVEPGLIHIAQSFSGVLVDRESDAVNGADSTKRIRNQDGNIGTCGTQSFCIANPVACYTCIHFQPWLNAEHENILKRLIEQRTRVIRDTGDRAVASALDPSIDAIKCVMVRCAARKSELEGDTA